MNSGNDVILYNGTYYLAYDGAWYTSASPSGPWAATATVPDAIYKIPPSSPSYAVTQVVVQEATPTTIVYSYPPSYSTGVYVAYGVPWYGTGWYYPPYIYGPYYYPYWGASYGHGYWYSPMTGAYGSRSVWYGPYGGYSYSQGYNPKTGRYGYVETAWDGEDWKSHSEKYNPRTGVATETSRHYSANDNIGAHVAHRRRPERQCDRHGAQDRLRQSNLDDESQNVEWRCVVDHAHVGWARRNDNIRQSDDRRRPHRNSPGRAPGRSGRQHDDHRLRRRTSIGGPQRRRRRNGDARWHLLQERPDRGHHDEAQRRHDGDQSAGE